MNKKIHVFGGGTLSHVRSHLALIAPAFGKTANIIYNICAYHPLNLTRTETTPIYRESLKMDVEMHLTAICQNGDKTLLTTEDLAKRVQEVVQDPLTKIVFMSAAIVDFKGNIITDDNRITPSGKYEPRLKSKTYNQRMLLTSEDKLISSIRKNRKDIFLVGFKTTTGDTKQQMYEAGLGLCKQASCNLVLVNDTKTRWNMIITPEEAAYHETQDRDEVLYNLVEMALYRSNLTFNKSTVVDGKPVPWSSELVPDSLRKVVNFCIYCGAYKEFSGSTVGHFACKIGPNEFLTSIRKTNFNNLQNIGLVRVTTDGPDSVYAYGAKPSVGGQSQRIIFGEHPEYDCVVHFHSPLKENHVNNIPIKSQREVECGSHQCGERTSQSMQRFGNLSAVMLDNHGPNIVFNRSIDPLEVIDFIENNFDLSKKTGGYNI